MSRLSSLWKNKKNNEDIRRRRVDLLADFDARSGGYDKWGFSMGDEPPPAEIALWAQQRADRMAYERNRGLEDSAAMSVRNAQGLLEAYRPGGVASMASGIHSQLADVYLNSRAEAPYLLADYQREQAFKARKANQKQGELKLAGQVIAAAAGVAGAALTGGASLALTMPMMAAAGAGGEYMSPGDTTLGGQPITSGGATAPISTVPPGYQGVDPGVPMPGGAPGTMALPGQAGGGSPWSPQQVQQFQQGFNRDMGGARGVGQASFGGPGGPSGGGGMGGGGAGASAQGGAGARGGGAGPGGPGGGGGVPSAAQALATHLYAEWIDSGSDFYRAMGSRLNQFGWSAA